MPEGLKVTLTSPQIRSIVTVLGDTLGDMVSFVTVDVRRQDEIASAYLAMVRAHLSEAGWRPQGVELAPWAVEALARVTTPPAPAKTAAPKAAAKKATPKRRRTDTRRRHDRPRPPAGEVEPPLPMTDDADDFVAEELAQ